MAKRATGHVTHPLQPPVPPIDPTSRGAGTPILETDDDQILNLSLRPQGFGEFVGQQAVVDNLQVAIQATKRRGEPLEHLLLAGPPGLGKTSLAHIVAHEMGSKITATSGPAIERAGDLIGVLTNLGRGDILFIDEIHRLSKVVEEFLYPAMESFEIDFVVDKGPYAKTIKFHLKHFTLIGATTRAGLLSNPLRSRFGMVYHLEFYQPEALEEIVRRSAKILGIQVETSACAEIARRARGTPRIANRLLRRVRDYAQVKGRGPMLRQAQSFDRGSGLSSERSRRAQHSALNESPKGDESKGPITKEVAEVALAAQGVDGFGLDPIDRKVLKTIMDFYGGGPVGIEALAAVLNEERDTIVDVVEPYLLSAGLLKRTARGRKVTRLAYQHLATLKHEPPELVVTQERS